VQRNDVGGNVGMRSTLEAVIEDEPSFCGRTAARNPKRHVRFRPASAPILVPVSSAHSAAGRDRCGDPAADSSGVVGARMGVPIVHIARGVP